MRRFSAGKCTTLLLTIVMILASTTILILAMDAAQAAIDAQPVASPTEKWSGTEFDAATAQITPLLYEVASAPVDYTLTRQDIPELMAYLDASKYTAVYLDDEVAMRVSKAGAVQIREDLGQTWIDAPCQMKSSDEFSAWLSQYQPNPGYSMEEVTERLKEGASVQAVALENEKTLYLILDGTWAQVVSTQSDLENSILLDGQGMRFTFSQAYQLSLEQLHAFYDRLVNCEILPEDAAKDMLSSQEAWLQEKEFLSFT